jgi:hypothetical protein
MGGNTVVVKGVVKPDGVLELEGHPDLPVGPVEVVVRALPPGAPTGEDWWPYLQRVRAEREAAGYQFMNDQEMQAHVDWLRHDEDRIDRIYREMEQERRRQGPS